VRQQLKRTLRELATEGCSHVAAEATGTTEAHQVRGGWLYSTPYRCPDCGLRFTERHAQPAPRSDAVG
jgi:hypothetical protein